MLALLLALLLILHLILLLILMLILLVTLLLMLVEMLVTNSHGLLRQVEGNLDTVLLLGSVCECRQAAVRGAVVEGEASRQGGLARGCLLA